MNQSATPPAQLYADIMEYIKDAHDLTSRGQFVELSSLDMRVRTLCEATQHMKVEEAKAFKPQLDEMMQQLHDLQELFMSRRDNLAQEIGEMGKHKQAARAYKQNEAVAARHATPKNEDNDN
jgi:hypothetical protein